MSVSLRPFRELIIARSERLVESIRDSDDDIDDNLARIHQELSVKNLDLTPVSHRKASPYTEYGARAWQQHSMMR